MKTRVSLPASTLLSARFPACPVLAFAALAVFGGCGGTPHRATGQAHERAANGTTRLGIVGGQPVVQGEWSGVVGLTFDGQLFCSGFAASRRIVVTAAHCISLVRARIGSSAVESRLGVYVGEGIQGGKVEPQGKVERAVMHPRFGKDIIKKNDLAFLVLENELENVEPLAPVVDAFDDRQALVSGARVTVIGFGDQDNSSSPKWGTKASVDLPIVKAWANQFQAGELHRDSCGGDSGGPVVSKSPDGRWQVVGVVSEGPTLCGEPSPDGSLNPGTYARLADMMCWLADASGEKTWGKGFNCTALHAPAPIVPSRANPFARICENDEAPPSEKHTIQMLLRVLDTRDCREAASRLADATYLDLRGLALSSLAPLAKLPKIQSMDLAINHLQDVKVLLSMPSLRRVNLELNLLSEFEDVLTLRDKGVEVNGTSAQFPLSSILLREEE